MPAAPIIRFAVIGLNHGHIYSQVNLLLRAGAQMACFFALEDEFAAAFEAAYPGTPRVTSINTVLDDPSIHLVASAAIPDERSALGIAVMQSGKDFFSDKPGFTRWEQLAKARQVQADTGRFYWVYFSERLEVAAAVQAGNLIQQGAIGTVISTIGMGPHLANLSTRPAWFFEKARYGGILNDIASHQFEQFLFFTGSTRAAVLSARAGNLHHPLHPGFEDFGDATVQGDGGAGYLRVDWYTPVGLGTWSDGRLFIQGTDGTIELRKYIDIAGRPGGDHLFLVNDKGITYIDCSSVELPFGRQLIMDVINRTETAIPQSQTFLACELALQAQRQAVKPVYAGAMEEH